MKNLISTLCIAAVAASSGPPASAGPAEKQAALAERFPAIRAALASCDAGAWRRIPWRTDPAAARQEAEATGRPLLVFLHRTVLTAEENGGEALSCLGARLTRGTAHSDPRVIEALGSLVVPLSVDVDAGAFDEALPGLRAARWVFERRDSPNPGFSLSVALTPDGERVLTSSLVRAEGTEPAAGDAGVPGERLLRALGYGAEPYLALIHSAVELAAGREEAAARGPAALRDFDAGLPGMGFTGARAHRRLAAPGLRPR